MKITLSKNVEAKLSEIGILKQDIEEALYYLDESPIEDERSEHRTIPSTVWFVSTTSDERPLFVAGIWDEENETFTVRTSRDASDKDFERWENGKW